MLVALAAAALVAGLPSSLQSSKKPEVIDITITDYASIRDEQRMAPEIRGILAKKLRATGRVNVLPGTRQLDAVLDRLRKKGDGNFDPKSAPELGKLKIGGYIVDGYVVQSSLGSSKNQLGIPTKTASIALHSELISLRSGRVVALLDESVSKEEIVNSRAPGTRYFATERDILRAVANELADRFVEQVAPHLERIGKVDLVDGNLVVIDMGANQGIVKGQYVLIGTVAVKETASGKSHRSTTVVAYGRVTQVEPETSEIEVGMLSGTRFRADKRLISKIKVGMMVQTTQKSG